LRATGSTLISQLIDSFIVLIIAFKFGNNWSWAQVLAIGCMNYIYKFSVAVLLTPVIYVAERKIENYLGADVAHKMKNAAMGRHEEPFTNIPAAG
ncbi:MAG: queuosine precursor transporter, partial [Bacteroidota bacterium]|nr:queuosine precursor transporter [Bacteroidota bacterium]